MLTFFFILIFAAELKLALDLIGIIRRFDAKVCVINEQITAIKPQITKTFTQIRIVINTLLLNTNKIKIKIAEKKDEYKFVLLKHIITTALFLALNVKGKQAMTVVELVFSAKDFTRSLLKLAHSLKK